MTPLFFIGFLVSQLAQQQPRREQRQRDDDRPIGRNQITRRANIEVRELPELEFSVFRSPDYTLWATDDYVCTQIGFVPSTSKLHSLLTEVHSSFL